VAGWWAWPLTIVDRGADGAAPRAPDPRAGEPLAEVQLFGRLDSRATQRALRFFRERRIKVAFVNLAQRPIAPTELRRFSARFGAQALLDVDSRAYLDQGLAYMRLEEDGITARLLSDNTLLRLPLARAGDRLSVGPDEAAWRSWLKATG
jgi:arsenate reductase